MTRAGYLWIISRMPGLWKLMYDVSDRRNMAEKPKIIRPSIYNEVSTEGFSGEAKRFFDWLSKNGLGFLTLLEYGFRFKRSEVRAEILHEPLESVRGRLLDQVRNGEDTFMALVEGVDDAWEVSLLKRCV